MNTTNHSHPTAAKASWSNDRQGPVYMRGIPASVWRSALRRQKSPSATASRAAACI